MKNITLFIALILFLNVNAQTKTIQFGAKGHDGIYDITSDTNGDLYLTGFFQGTFKDLKAKGDTDIFIAKMNKDGNFLWLKQLGSEFRKRNEITEFGKYISIDNDNNVYVLGLYYDTLETSSGKLVSKGKQDVFLAKYDNKGNQQWIRSYGNHNNESIKKLVVNNNEIYFVTRLGESKLNNKGTNHLFKVAADGNLVWSKEIKLSNNELNDLDITQVKYSQDSFFMLCESKGVKHVLSYNSNGERVKDYELSSATNSDILSITVTDKNSMYILEQEKSSSNKNTFGIRKVDMNGNTLWFKEHNKTILFNPEEIIVDSDKISVIGAFKENIDADKYSQGSLVFQFDLLGELHAMHTYIGENQSRIIKLLIKDNVLYSVGQFYSNIEFAQKEIVSRGRIDSFIDIKYLNQENSANHFGFSVYPNPNKGEFYIKNVEQFNKIQLFDMSGKLVFETSTENKNKIQIKRVMNGLYNLVLFKKDGGREAVKLLINK